MNRKLKLVTATALLLAALSGCGANKTMYSVEYPEEDRAMAMTMDVEYEAAASGNSVMYAAKDTTAPLPQNRKWIITMDIEAETDDLDAAMSAVTAQIAAMDGYCESQRINNNSSYRTRRNAYLTVRIPADRVDEFVSQVSGIANVVSNSRSVRDITLAYTDTEGRVNALKTEEKRLLELMEQAENMSDLLEIESRLTDVRYELERNASTLRVYDNQVDYASVDLSISEVQKYTPVEEPGFFQRIKDGLSESIVDLGQTIVGAIAWFIIDLPYLVILGLLGWGIAAAIKRSARKRKEKKQASKEQKES